jgi:multidrug efflux system membrane fusion protein
MDKRTTEDRQGVWPQQVEPAPKSSRGWRRILGTVIVLILVGATGWWTYERLAPRVPTSRPAPARPASSVVAATVATGDITITLNGLGTVTSLSTVTIRTQISGYLSRVAFEEGQTVQKGDVLAEIDSRPYEAALEQMQGQLARDQAILDGARVDLERYKRLSAQKAVPQQQYDQQQALVKQDEGQVAADQGLVDTAKVNLAYCRITAPASGRIGLRQVDQGNYVTPADPNGLVVITQIEPISVIFTIPEDNLPQVQKRLRAGATLQVSAYDRSGTTELAKGTLTTLDNQLDTTTGTLKLRAQFPNEDETLFPNQFVNIRLLVDVLHEATTMPTAAAQRGAPGTFVYVVNQGDTVSVRKVELGPGDGERVAVMSGLSPGERVVVDGADRLRDGAKVTLRQPNDNRSAPTSPSVGANGQQGDRKGSHKGQ